jgi:hypothetical protein
MGVNSAEQPHHPKFRELIAFLSRVPAVQSNDRANRGFGSSIEPAGWWVKFSLDIKHPLAWSTVQEFGHILNYLSLEHQLPTVFKPVSPPPYLNGGPQDYLSWVIECPVETAPSRVAEWLEGRLPKPVEDQTQWVAC